MEPVEETQTQRRGRFWSINAQLILPFSLLLVLVVSCVIFAVAVLFYGHFSRQNNAIIQDSLRIAAYSVENRVNILRRLMPVIRGEEACTRALEEGEASGAALTQLAGLYAYGLQSVFLVTTDNRVLSPVYQDSEFGEQMLEITGFHQYRSSGRDEMFSGPHGFPYLTPPEDNLYNTRLSYFYTLREQDQYDVYGYVLVNITQESIFIDCESAVRSIFDQFYVIDGRGNLIYTSGKAPKSETLEYARRYSQGNYAAGNTTYGGDTYFHYSLASYPDWHIVGVASRDTLLRSTRLLIWSVILIGLLGMVLVVFISAVLSRRITRPLQQVGTAMASFQSGDIPLKVDMEEATGEMGQMVHGFNAMLDNIRANIDTIYREQEEKQSAELEALRYQLQSLQNQINPHFLYNTLNVVSYLALDNRSDEIRTFIQSLNQLLRATLSNMDDTVTLERELTFLRSYLSIMEYRYPGQFEVTFQVAKAAGGCLVPKLILQPIVENALLHGIFPTGRAGAVTVSATEERGQLCMTVTDNGVGMDSETLAGLLEKPKGFTSFGVRNVNDRLRLSYGPECGLTIDSRKGEGTTVSFRIPIALTEDEEEYHG